MHYSLNSYYQAVNEEKAGQIFIKELCSIPEKLLYINESATKTKLIVH